MFAGLPSLAAQGSPSTAPPNATRMKQQLTHQADTLSISNHPDCTIWLGTRVVRHEHELEPGQPNLNLRCIPRICGGMPKTSPSTRGSEESDLTEPRTGGVKSVSVKLREEASGPIKVLYPSKATSNTRRPTADDPHNLRPRENCG